MLVIQKVDTLDRTQVRAFVDFPYRLYARCPQWVPPPRVDQELMLNRRKHPFYEHSDADFFLARRDGRVVGRVAALENRNYNAYQGTRRAQFYLFDSEADPEAVAALFERVFEWARARGLNQVIGPKGFGAFDGCGVLVEGFEHRQMMTMVNYNYPYYGQLLVGLGFEKAVDYGSFYLDAAKFRMPERVHRIAERVERRGDLSIKRFRSNREIYDWAGRIGEAYNRAFVKNWEYCPLTQGEMAYVRDNLLTVADPRLVKLILHGDTVAGFLCGFPDVSAALQRARGRLYPWNLADLLLEMRRTPWMALNGAGILGEFQGRGGNALLYAEMEKTVRSYQFKHADLVLVAETAVQMRQDLENVGGQLLKNFRVYQRAL